MLDKIHFLGMSPASSQHSKPIAVEICGFINVVHEMEDTYCLAMGGLAARYSGAELETLGEGDRVVGLLNVISTVQATKSFDYDDPRPLQDEL